MRIDRNNIKLILVLFILCLGIGYANGSPYSCENGFSGDYNLTYCAPM